MMQRLLRYSGIFALDNCLDIFVDFLRLMTIQVDRVYFRRRPPDRTPSPTGDSWYYSWRSDGEDEEETYFDANSSCSICNNEAAAFDIPFDYHWAPHEQILNRAYDNNNTMNNRDDDCYIINEGDNFEDSSDILPDQYSALYIEHDCNPNEEVQEEEVEQVEEIESTDHPIENNNSAIDFETTENENNSECVWENDKGTGDDEDIETWSIDSHVENNNLEVDFGTTRENNFDYQWESENDDSTKKTQDDENNNTEEYEENNFNTQIDVQNNDLNYLDYSEETNSNLDVQPENYEWLEPTIESDKESQLTDNNLDDNHSSLLNNIETNNNNTENQNFNLLQKFKDILLPSDEKCNGYLDSILNTIKDVKERNKENLKKTNESYTNSNTQSIKKLPSNTFNLNIEECKMLIKNIKEYLAKKKKNKKRKKHNTKKHCEINNNLENTISSTSNDELYNDVNESTDVNLNYMKNPLVSKSFDEKISDINLAQIGKPKKLNVPETSANNLESDACKYKHFKKVIILKENARIQEQRKINCTETSTNFKESESVEPQQNENRFNETNMNQIHNNFTGSDVNEREDATTYVSNIFWEEPDIDLARKFCELYNSSNEASPAAEVTKSSSEGVGLGPYEFLRESKRSKRRRKRKHALEATSDVDDPTYEPPVKRAIPDRIHRPKRRTSIFKSYCEDEEEINAHRNEINNIPDKLNNLSASKEGKVGIVLKITKDSQNYKSSLLA